MPRQTMTQKITDKPDRSQLMPGGTRWAGKTKDQVIEELERRLADAHRQSNETAIEIRALVEAGYSNADRRLEVLRKIGEIVDADPTYLRKT